jgi:hypothetical protein
MAFSRTFSFQKSLPGIYQVNNVPAVVIERPFYLEDPVHQTKHFYKIKSFTEQPYVAQARGLDAAWIHNI